MIEFQKIKRTLIVFLKGLPIIILFLLASLFLAKKIIQYSQPKYQTMAKIKLDDQKYGFSGNNLYGDFDMFTDEKKYVLEAEILKSPLLIGKTVEEMKLDWQVERVGNLKNTVLYKDIPFNIETIKVDSLNKDIQLFIEINTAGQVLLINEDEEIISSGLINQPLTTTNATVKIVPNAQSMNKAFSGKYLLTYKNKNSWIKTIQSELDVQAVDKEISILRVVYTHHNPEFAADFVNLLCEIYVQDYIETKTSAANQTLNFIDSRLIEIEKELSASENKLEGYKLDNNVVNTFQETETGLREISKLKLQLINMQAEETGLQELENYLSNSDYYEESAINFGFGDLNLVELVKKLKMYTDEKRDLELKYTANDERVINCQAKIDDVEKYIKEAIERNKEDISIKKATIQMALDDMEHQFDDFPTREKDMRRLEREFIINENVYNFLSQKKIEAQIAASAMISFHRIIQEAEIPTIPKSPNRILITFVCGFFGLGLGFIVVFSRRMFAGKIYNRNDIERLTAAPVLGSIGHHISSAQKTEEFAGILGQLEATNDGLKTIAFTSSMRNEGKSYAAQNMRELYRKMGYKTCFINLSSPSNADENLSLAKLQSDPQAFIKSLSKSTSLDLGYSPTDTPLNLVLAHKNFPIIMEALKENFDKIIIDTAGAVIKSDAIIPMKYADQVIYVLRARKSSVQYVPNIDLLKMDYQIENIKVLLNEAHQTTSYSGMFTSSKLNHYRPKISLLGKISHLYSTYSR